MEEILFALTHEALKASMNAGNQHTDQEKKLLELFDEELSLRTKHKSVKNELIGLIHQMAEELEKKYECHCEDSEQNEPTEKPDATA